MLLWIGLGCIILEVLCLHYLMDGILNEPTFTAMIERLASPIIIVVSATVAFAITIALQVFFDWLHLI